MTPPCPAKCGKNASRNSPWRARESHKSRNKITSKTAFSSPLEFQVARGEVRYWVRHKECPLCAFPRAPLIESWQPTRAGLFCVKRTIFLSRRSGQLRVFMIRFGGRGGGAKRTFFMSDPVGLVARFWVFCSSVARYSLVGFHLKDRRDKNPRNRRRNSLLFCNDFWRFPLKS